MAKYSTGKSTTIDDSCQICGATEGKLTTAKVEGAVITVCKSCEPDEPHRQDHKEETVDEPTTSSSDTEATKTRDVHTKNKKVGYTLSKTDPQWVENTDYGNTNTPYMQKHYDTKIEQALEKYDLTLEQLSEDINAPLEDLEFLANGNALEKSVGRNVIEAVEKALDIELIESV